MDVFKFSFDDYCKKIEILIFSNFLNMRDFHLLVNLNHLIWNLMLDYLGISRVFIEHKNS